MTDTEILLQLWADTLADVQADKTFMQQVERDAQAAAFASGPEPSGPRCSAACKRPVHCRGRE